MRKAVSGLRAWLVQRVSAVYMLFFIVFLLTHFIVDPPRSYLAWHDWMLAPGSTSSPLFLLPRCWRTPGWACGTWSWITFTRLPFAFSCFHRSSFISWDLAHGLLESYGCGTVEATP